MFKPIFLLFALSLNAFGQSIVDINASNPQRTRVLNTQGLKAPPQEVFWKTEKLFELRNSNWIGSFDLPTPAGFSVPIVAGEYLYFSLGDFNSYMFAVDKATGKKATVLKFENTGISPPAAGRNMVFFGTAAGRLLAYDPMLREQKWTYLDRGHSFEWIPPVVDGELVYASATGKGMYAFAAETGAVKWLFKSSQYIHPPAVAGGKVFMTVEPDRLVAVERETGVVTWEVRVKWEPSAPAIMDNRIFLLFKNGEIRSYSTTDGVLQWKSKDTLRNGSALALYKGLIYFVGRNDGVIALDAATAEEKFRFATKQRCQAPIIASELLYVTCLDNKLHALSTATLKPIWEMPNGNTTPPTPVFADGVMYWLTSDGYMFALR